MISLHSNINNAKCCLKNKKKTNSKLRRGNFGKIFGLVGSITIFKISELHLVY